jgi:hypothetical protein
MHPPLFATKPERLTQRVFTGTCLIFIYIDRNNCLRNKCHRNNCHRNMSYIDREQG